MSLLSKPMREKIHRWRRRTPWDVYQLVHYKANRWRNQWARRHYGETSSRYPVGMQIEVSNRCNLKCTMCEHTYWKVKEMDMSFDTFKKILAPMPPMKLFLSGTGESFLNREFTEMIFYAKSRGHYISFADNATLITQPIAEKIVKAKVDLITFSLESVNPEHYARIRVNGTIERFLGGLDTLHQEKIRQKSMTPLMHSSVVLMRENFRELPEIVRVVGQHGIRYLGVQEPIEGEGHKNIRMSREELADFKMIYEEGLRLSRELGVLIQKNEFMDGKMRKRLETNRDANIRCMRPIPWESMYVFANGDVWPCCWMTQRDERPARFSVGSVLENTIEEIWNGPRFRQFRKQIVDHSEPVPEGCRGCRFLSVTPRKAEKIPA